MPMCFTLHYDDRIVDIDDKSGDVAATPGVGWMYFDSSIQPGHRIPVPSYSPRPAGLGLRQFKGYLDTDGRLKTEPGGSAGIRLWANDPEYNLTRLQYKVTAELTDTLGRPVEFHSFYFDAPRADVESNLVDYMPAPHQKYGRGPASYLRGGEFNDVGQLVLQNDDGSLVDPITPSPGVLFIVNNGDGTATIG